MSQTGNIVAMVKILLSSNYRQRDLATVLKSGAFEGVPARYKEDSFYSNKQEAALSSHYGGPRTPNNTPVGTPAGPGSEMRAGLEISSPNVNSYGY